jgi:hypothetical protein
MIFFDGDGDDQKDVANNVILVVFYFVIVRA